MNWPTAPLSQHGVLQRTLRTRMTSGKEFARSVVSRMLRPTGFDLRLLNASDQPRVATVRCALHLAGVAWITLGGDLRQDVRLNDGLMQFSLRPWEIATLRITR